MAEPLFTTNEKKQEAVNHFKRLIADPAWILLVQVIEEKITQLESQLDTFKLNGDTVQEFNDIRAHKHALERVIFTPQTLIYQLTNLGGRSLVDMDNYLTQEQVDQLEEKYKNGE